MEAMDVMGRLEHLRSTVGRGGSPQSREVAACIAEARQSGATEPEIARTLREGEAISRQVRAGL